MPVEGSWNPQQKWVFRRMEDFSQLIPPQALRALAYLREIGIVPEGMWVADKVDVYHRRLPDPILCASFGRWVVALAAWA